MTITVGVDTYISLADARQYVIDNGLSSLPDDDADAEALLKRAAKGIDRRWGNRFIGMRRTYTQKLAWPRDVNVQPGYRGPGEAWLYTLDADGNPRLFNDIPPEMGEAQVEMALLMQDGADPLEQNEAPITEKSVEVGGIKSVKKYASSYQTPLFYNIATILRPLLVPVGGIKATRGA